MSDLPGISATKALRLVMMSHEDGCEQSTAGIGSCFREGYVVNYPYSYKRVCDSCVAWAGLGYADAETLAAIDMLERITVPDLLPEDGGPVDLEEMAALTPENLSEDLIESGCPWVIAVDRQNRIVGIGGYTDWQNTRWEIEIQSDASSPTLLKFGIGDHVYSWSTLVPEPSIGDIIRGGSHVKITEG